MAQHAESLTPVRPVHTLPFPADTHTNDTRAPQQVWQRTRGTLLRCSIPGRPHRPPSSKAHCCQSQLRIKPPDTAPTTRVLHHPVTSRRCHHHWPPVQISLTCNARVMVGPATLVRHVTTPRSDAQHRSRPAGGMFCSPPLPMQSGVAQG